MFWPYFIYDDYGTSNWKYLIVKVKAMHLRIPWTEQPGRPRSMGSQRVGHDLAHDRWTDGWMGGVPETGGENSPRCRG